MVQFPLYEKLKSELRERGGSVHGRGGGGGNAGGQSAEEAESDLKHVIIASGESHTELTFSHLSPSRCFYFNWDTHAVIRARCFRTRRFFAFFSF